MAIITTTAIVGATALVNATIGFLTALGSLVAAILVTGGTIIGACATLAKYFPPPPKGSSAEKVHSLINKIAQNSGYAANNADSE
jgi:hypothetical protein